MSKSKRRRNGRGKGSSNCEGRSGSTADITVKANPNHKDNSCFLYSKKKHWKPEYSEKNNLNFTPVNNVQSKNDRASLKLNKRGKKNQ